MTKFESLVNSKKDQWIRLSPVVRNEWVATLQATTIEEVRNQDIANGKHPIERDVDGSITFEYALWLLDHAKVYGRWLYKNGVLLTKAGHRRM